MKATDTGTGYQDQSPKKSEIGRRATSAELHRHAIDTPKGPRLKPYPPKNSRFGTAGAYPYGQRRAACSLQHGGAACHEVLCTRHEG